MRGWEWGEVRRVSDRFQRPWGPPQHCLDRHDVLRRSLCPPAWGAVLLVPRTWSCRRAPRAASRWPPAARGAGVRGPNRHLHTPLFSYIPKGQSRVPGKIHLRGRPAQRERPATFPEPAQRTLRSLSKTTPCRQAAATLPCVHAAERRRRSWGMPLLGALDEGREVPHIPPTGCSSPPLQAAPAFPRPTLKMERTLSTGQSDALLSLGGNHGRAEGAVPEQHHSHRNRINIVRTRC